MRCDAYVGHALATRTVTRHRRGCNDPQRACGRCVAYPTAQFTPTTYPAACRTTLTGLQVVRHSDFLDVVPGCSMDVWFWFFGGTVSGLLVPCYTLLNTFALRGDDTTLPGWLLLTDTVAEATGFNVWLGLVLTILARTRRSTTAVVAYFTPDAMPAPLVSGTCGSSGLPSRTDTASRVTHLAFCVFARCATTPDLPLHTLPVTVTYTRSQVPHYPRHLAVPTPA